MNGLSGGVRRRWVCELFDGADPERGLMGGGDTGAARMPRSRPTPRHAKVGVMLAALVCLGTSGCGGSAEAPPPSVPVSVSQEALGLTILFVPKSGNATLEAANGAVQSELVRAGYKLVVNRRGPYDVAVTPEIAATEEKSLFAVSVNGKRDVKLRVHLTLSLASPDSEIVDQVATDFVTPAGQVKGSDVSAVVAAIAASDRVSKYARDRKLARAKDERGRAEAAEASYNRKEQQARVREEADWNGARAQGCAMPTSLDACDNVRLYTATYPEGVHVAEAKTAIEQAQPAMAKLQKDENAWKAAGVSACRARATPADCEGVEVYSVKFAAGMHADEARQLLQK
jgi:hypothetical protein